ncbi:MAG: ATP-binding protein [bacterium]|nr:ATP-binding protein [bacterium]
MKQYSKFAAKYKCKVTPKKPFWQKDFPLSDGSTLRLHGLTSTIISDGSDNDKENKLILGEAQVQLHKEDGVAYLTLCHHPMGWLLDSKTVSKRLNLRARIQLFGHEHAQSVEQVSFNNSNDTLRIFSGAVHPDRRESGWKPRYNVISIEVAGAGDSRELMVRLYPRVWNDDILEFQPDPLAKNDNFIDFSLPLEPWGDGSGSEDTPVESESTAPDNKFLTKLPSKNIKLVGREKDLAAFEKLIGSEGLVLLVNGIGGIGKTELCKRYFWKHLESYEYVGWVNYYSGIKDSIVSNFKKSLIDIADSDTYDIIYNKIIDFLQSLPKNSLLIFDNVDNEDDTDLDIIKALPLKVAVTSRAKLKGFNDYGLGFFLIKKIIKAQ